MDAAALGIFNPELVQAVDLAALLAQDLFNPVEEVSWGRPI